jgi:hypothetical protein
MVEEPHCTHLVANGVNARAAVVASRTGSPTETDDQRNARMKYPPASARWSGGGLVLSGSYHQRALLAHR